MCCSEKREGTSGTAHRPFPTGFDTISQNHFNDYSLQNMLKIAPKPRKMWRCGLFDKSAQI